MTDDEHRKLAEASRRLELQEALSKQQALRRRRTKWFWLALLPILAPPLFWLGLYTDNLLMRMIPARTGLHIFILTALGWIGYCTATITAVNQQISGTPPSIAQRVGIFLGLLALNAVIGGALFFAGCVIALRGFHG